MTTNNAVHGACEMHASGRLCPLDPNHCRTCRAHLVWSEESGGLECENDACTADDDVRYDGEE